MANLKVTLEGRGPVTISDSMYVAQGGEGTIYKLADTIVKVFTDKSKTDGMRDKMKGFARLKHDYIAAPQGLVTNAKGELVGLYMPFVKGEALSLIFTNAFRNRERFHDDDASVLVDRIRQTFVFAHYNNAILVDPNELNWLAVLHVKDGPQPRVIDVDSWVIDGNVPASVPKMPSIRDWHGKTVSNESDWFAFAVISFQIYCGIHPFKGTAPGYKLSELERRMKDNVSVFSKDVRLNNAVRSFTCIPSKLLDWFRTVFSTSDRSIPPSPFEKAVATPQSIAVARVVVTASGKLKFEKMFSSVVDNAVRVFPCGVSQTNSGELVRLDTKRSIGSSEPGFEVVRVDYGWLKFDDRNGFAFTSETEGTRLELCLDVRKIITCDDRMLAVTPQGLAEIKFRNVGKPLVSTGETWDFMFNSTKWFEGCGIMDAMGSTFLIAPFGPSSVGQIRVRELDGLRPVNAKAGNRFVSIISLNDSGEYVKTELTFTEDYSEYKVWTGATDSPELNLTILPKGVMATIVQDGELTIFSRTGAMTKIQDKFISTEMTLARWGNVVLAIHKGEVWKITAA